MGKISTFFIKGHVRSSLYTLFHPHLSFRVQVWSILWILLTLVASSLEIQLSSYDYHILASWLPLYRPVLIWWCPGHQHLSALSILGTNSLVFNTTIAFFHAACGSIRLQVLLIALATLYWRSPNGQNVSFFLLKGMWEVCCIYLFFIQIYPFEYKCEVSFGPSHKWHLHTTIYIYISRAQNVCKQLYIQGCQ